MKPFSSSSLETMSSVSQKKKYEGTTKSLSDDRSGRFPKEVKYIPVGGGGPIPEPYHPDLLNSCKICCSLEHAVVSCPFLDCIPKEALRDFLDGVEPVGGGDSYTATPASGEEARIMIPTVLCSECSFEHWPYPECPFKSCKVCFSPEHLCVWCPYLTNIPRGADYNRVEFETICQCGNMFNEEKWACAFCGREMPRVKVKSCAICRGRHCSHECPIDKVQAAEYKAIRDHDLSAGPRLVPHSEESADAVWGESTSSWAESNPIAFYL